MQATDQRVSSLQGRARQSLHNERRVVVFLLYIFWEIMQEVFEKFFEKICVEGVGGSLIGMIRNRK